MDVGTGKTITALNLVLSKEKSSCLIYITKASLINQTKVEIDKLIHTTYKIISYEAIAQSDRIYLELIQFAEENKDNNIFIIADESTALKNDSKTAERCLKIRKYCTCSLIMTATPITKDELDLYNQLEFLSSNILKMSKSDFISNFYEKITYKKIGEQEKSFLKFSDVNKGYLQSLLDMIAIYGNINIEFDVNESFKMVQPSVETEKEYLENKDEFLEIIKNIGFEDGNLLNFLQYANKTFSVDKNKNKAVADYVRNKKVIVFANYIEEYNQIIKKLDRCYFISGSTKQNDRSKIIKNWIESECAPLIIMLGVGGHGLNLQYTSEVVFASVSFDWEKMEQAKGRISRMGQKSKKINYTYILSESPIVKMIRDNLIKKQGLINSLSDEVILYFKKEFENECI